MNKKQFASVKPSLQSKLRGYISMLRVPPALLFMLLLVIVMLFVAYLESSKRRPPSVTLRMFAFPAMPEIGTTIAGQTIRLGGFSGLLFEGKSSDGKLQFLTHTDRGPNAESININGISVRPFVLPQYQAEWVRFTLDIGTGTLAITERIALTRPDGGAMSGLPNLKGQPGMAYSDEFPVDLMGKEVANDGLGQDLEGIVRSEDGSFWMVEEYRPSILHFSQAGKLIARYIPQDSSGKAHLGVQALPAVYALRRDNRGFEAVAFQDNKIYAFMQSPLDNPDTPNDDNSENSGNLRILEFDIKTKTCTAEYLYLLENGANARIGDAVAFNKGEFLVVEHNNASGNNAFKKVFRINLNGATDLFKLASNIVSVGGILEGLDADQLKARNIFPVKKELFVDLIVAGYDSVDKLEGLALIDTNTIAIVNDNDFGVGSTTLNLRTGRFDSDPIHSTPTILGLITLETQK